MSNPILTLSKPDARLTLTTGAKKLFQSIYRDQTKSDKVSDSVSRIKVSDMISKMSFYYEKIRNAVDYVEESTIRKDAIARILKRQLVIEGTIKLNKNEDNEAIAKHLLVELIRAGYLPNNKLPEAKIGEIAKIIDRYLKLRKYGLEKIISSGNFFGKSLNKIKDEMELRTELTNWILALAASEIEEDFSKNAVIDTMVSDMYDVVNASISLPDNLPYERDLPIQIYIGIYRNFLKADNDILSYLLFKYFNADWSTADDDKIIEVAGNINNLRLVMDQQLEHPLASQLNKIISRYTVYFNVLKDVISENPVAIYEGLTADPKSFARKVKQACAKRYSKAKSKLWRAAIRSMIYILLTKSVFAVALEVPATKFFGEQIDMTSLLINVSFPAILLFAAVMFMPFPGDSNTTKIVEGVSEITFQEKRRKEPMSLRKPVKRKGFVNSVFNFLYTIAFFISFGGIIYLLDRINFSWVSIILFLFFLAFVSFFIIRISRIAKELIVIEAKENIFKFFLDFFYIPIIATGKWLSNKFDKMNLFVFILDFIIEAPFKIFIEIAEDWTKYVKERKDELS